MSDFTTADLVGLPLYARETVMMLRYPEVGAQIMRTVVPGQSVGVIKGWNDRRGSGDNLYLEFDGPGGFSVMFAAYDRALDLPRLKLALDARIEAERREQLGPNGRALEDAQNAVQQTAAAAGGQIFTGALILGGLYVVGRIITK